MLKQLRIDAVHSILPSKDIMTDTRSQMSIQYLRDISVMLSIVSAVREGCIDRHLQAEREFLKLAFDHVNYSRYNSYQHVLLSHLKQNNDEAHSDLVLYGYGCTSTDRVNFY